MKRIKQLSKNLINQIAAGEVIERPASVVKELVENSIDAGATKIEVHVANGGRDIRVSDNGSGIHKDDVALAFSKHATSKILEERDLWGIDTLGFRGEALSSVISVAKVTCTTKTAEDESGIKVECENSELKISDTGCAVGTTMEIKDLFFNTPARLKFLRKPQTEIANVVEILQSLAISYPNVSFTLIHKKHTSVKTTGTGDLQTVISEIYSKDMIKDLAPVSKTDKPFKLKITGFVSTPNFTRSNKKAIYIFVNNRPLKCPILTKAIESAYKELIPSGRYPFVVLSLNLPPKEVDVNVHPTKREIRYLNPNLIYNFVQSAVKGGLETAWNEDSHSLARFSNSKAEDDFLSIEQKKETLEEHSAPESTVEVEFQKAEQFVYLPPQSEEKDLSFKQSAVYEPNTLKKTASAKEPVSIAKFNANTVQDDDVSYKERVEKSVEFYAPSPVQTKIIKPEQVAQRSKPKIIGQLMNTYILIETKEGLQLIDQHIAHERVLYEKLKESKEHMSQLLLTSDVIELEPVQIAQLEEHKDVLAKFGYEFIKITDKTITFKKVPQMIADKSPQNLINEILDNLNDSLETLENQILISTACHAAVKANEVLKQSQMERLIEDWSDSKFPLTCPHGRKICHTITPSQIAAFFGRTK